MASQINSSEYMRTQGDWWNIASQDDWFATLYDEHARPRHARAGPRQVAERMYLAGKRLQIEALWTFKRPRAYRAVCEHVVRLPTPALGARLPATAARCEWCRCLAAPCGCRGLHLQPPAPIPYGKNMPLRVMMARSWKTGWRRQLQPAPARHSAVRRLWAAAREACPCVLRVPAPSPTPVPASCAPLAPPASARTPHSDPHVSEFPATQRAHRSDPLAPPPPALAPLCPAQQLGFPCDMRHREPLELLPASLKKLCYQHRQEMLTRELVEELEKELGRDRDHAKLLKLLKAERNRDLKSFMKTNELKNETRQRCEHEDIETNKRRESVNDTDDGRRRTLSDRNIFVRDRSLNEDMGDERLPVCKKFKTWDVDEEIRESRVLKRGLYFIRSLGGRKKKRKWSFGCSWFNRKKWRSEDHRKKGVKKKKWGCMYCKRRISKSKSKIIEDVMDESSARALQLLRQLRQRTRMSIEQIDEKFEARQHEATEKQEEREAEERQAHVDAASSEGLRREQERLAELLRRARCRPGPAAQDRRRAAAIQHFELQRRIRQLNDENDDKLSQYKDDFTFTTPYFSQGNKLVRSAGVQAACGAAGLLGVRTGRGLRGDPARFHPEPPPPASRPRERTVYLRDMDGVHVDIRRIRRRILENSEKSVYVIGPKVYNRLPQFVRDAPSAISFKRKLQSWLLEKQFYNFQEFLKLPVV